VQGVPFVINETPYVCWDWDLKEKNLDFLRGIDSRYFQYVVESNIDNLESDDKHRAALSIRLAYSHALETLFALLGALVQAPTCPLGWLLSYRKELPEVVRTISEGQKILTRGKSEQVTWQNLSDGIHEYMQCDNEKKDWIKRGFAESWRKFASDFLLSQVSDEYNSLKHGLRARLGGFQLAVGVETIPGVRAKPEEMQVIGDSIFGASYFVREKLGDTSVNFRPRRHSRNWNPENILNAVVVCAMSINNTVSCLRILNGDAGDKCEFRSPTTADYFETPWANRIPVNDMSMDTNVSVQDVELKTKDFVLSTYARDSTAS